MPANDEPEYVQLIADCEQRESRMNNWERGFIDSMQDRVGRGVGLTGPQLETLNEIWEKVTARG